MPSTTDTTVGESVTFDASGSDPGDGTIESYKWSFGDGTTETTTDPTISHAYDDSDEYTVTLNVSGTTGSDVTTKTISVDSKETEATKPTFSRDGKFFGFDPYPVEAGEVPTVRVDTRNAESVSVTAAVNGQSATIDMESYEKRNSGEEIWRANLKNIDSLDLADLDPGEEVDIEITATNQSKQTTIDSFYSKEQNPYIQDEDLPSSTDFDYYIFEDVKDIGIVFSVFRNSESVDSAPENITLWKQTNERSINNYFGSGYGSMGAVGYDFEYYSNEFYQLSHNRAYYENRSEADWIDENLGETADEEGRCEPYPTDPRSGVHTSCGFHLVQDETQDQSGIDPGEYYYWITLFPGESIANPDTPAGLGIGAITFDQKNIVSPIGEGRNTLVHEMVHAKPIYASHPVPRFLEKQVIEKPNNRKLSNSPISVPTRVGLGNHNAEKFLGLPYSVPSGTNWLNRDVETFSSKNANTIVEYKSVKSYEFGDNLPVIHIDKDNYKNLNLYDDRYVMIEARYDNENDRTIPIMNIIRQTNTYFYGNKVIENSSTEGIAGRIYPRYPNDPSGSYQLENGVEIAYEELDSYSPKVEVSIEIDNQDANIASINQNIQYPQPSSDIESHSNTSPDLDLVAIDGQGRRVGVTESGDYVNEIPGANASGDTNGVEWISVPKDIDVEYKIVSEDTEEYINQTDVSAENVTVNYESSIATYGDDPDIVSQNGNLTITNGTTEQGKNETIKPGASTSAVNDTAIAGFNIVPLSPEPTQPVTLNGSIASSLNGSIESYEWTYGNNTTATGQTLSRNYSTTGDYDVTLSVTDSNGATDNITRTIDVTDSPPQAILNTTTDGSVTEGTQVTLSARQSSDYLGITDYRWDMDGDNETERTTNATTPVINYTYSTPGTYEPAVTVVDTANQTTTASRTLNVTAGESSGGGGGGGGAGGAGGAGSGGGSTEQGPPSIQAVESTLQLVSPTTTTSVPLEDTDSSQNGLTVTPTDPTTVEEVTFNNADLSGTVDVTEYTEPPATISEDVAASVAADFESQSSSDTALSDPSEISVLAVTDIAPTVAATEDSSATVELSIDADQVDNPGQLRVIKETYSEEAQATRWSQLPTEERSTAGDEITMTVEVDSFSLFAITEVDGATQTSDTETTGQDPDTGESGGIGIAGIVGVVAVVLIAGVALYLRD
jgi:PKD repeat protein